MLASSSNCAATCSRCSTVVHTPWQRSCKLRTIQTQALGPMFLTAGLEPTALQDVIVGGAVTAAVGAALYSGLKKEPQPCDLCAGNGGIRCFACSGDGTMELIDKSILTTPQKRDFVGRSNNPRGCRVCGGSGLVLCSRCKGSGFLNKF